MQVTVRPCHLYLPIRQSAQAGRQGRRFLAYHTRIRNKNDIGGEQLFVSRTEIAETDRADLLFSFEDKLKVAVQNPRLQSRLKPFNLNHRLPLIIVGTTCIDPSVAYLGFERVALPQLQRLGRHHIVMSVHEHRRRRSRNDTLGIHHRIASCRHHFRTRRPRSEQQLFPPLGTLDHVRLMLALRTHRRDTQQTEPLVTKAVLMSFDIRSYFHNIF